MLSILKEVFRDNIKWINDIDVLREALVFIRNDKGRPEAQIGEHDDLITTVNLILLPLQKSNSLLNPLIGTSSSNSSNIIFNLFSLLSVISNT